jgi:predicted N-acetyltransferase YhbS
VITSTFHIRRGRADDSAALTALARRSKARWGYPVEWLDAWSEDLTLLPHCIERHETFVAEVGADIVGVAVLQRTTYGGELEHVWVHPDHEGRGIGRALVTAALEAARRAGCGSVRVLSDPFAEPFYRRLHGQRVGAVPAPMPGAPDLMLPELRFELTSGD